jgi:hypothetical protein
MQSRPGYIGFQGLYSQLSEPCIGFREEYNDEIPKNDSSGMILIYQLYRHRLYYIGKY